MPQVMFRIHLMHRDISKDRDIACLTLPQAMTTACSEALYGAWWNVKVFDESLNQLAFFKAEEMRDVARRKREARYLQVSPGFLRGLQVHEGLEVDAQVPLDKRAMRNSG